jgi:ATP-GRASP peptide maturase of grasp-with-spasm system
MVLIISDNKDQSTCDVIDWLKYIGTSYLLLADNETFSIIEMAPNGSFIVQIRDILLKSEDISTVWYRRGFLKLPRISINAYTRDQNISELFCSFFHQEQTGLVDFFHDNLNKIKSINNQNTGSLNKLSVLQKAEECGLSIPNSIITSYKAVLKQFLKKNDQVITKAGIGDISFFTEQYVFSAYTELVDEQYLATIPEAFAPSFFQKLIAKKFEIRAFYLDEKIYSMAIFSQRNPKTTIDFRHYDRKIPNRRVPFQLPKEIEQKIVKFMNLLELTSGSIDLIYGTDEVFYFLEVNPIGQFGMTSYPCNYDIEKTIAIYLSACKKK